MGALPGSGLQHGDDGGGCGLVVAEGRRRRGLRIGLGLGLGLGIKRLYIGCYIG